MGALSVSKTGPAVYGAIRGVQDFKAEGRTEESHALDQDIRRSRLDAENVERPLRQRALELGVEDAEHRRDRRGVLESREDELAELNLDMAKLTAEDRERASTEGREALRRQKALRAGLSKFTISADPQAVADAMAEMYPEFQGGKATRNEDGSITAFKPDGTEFRTFKGKKWEDGQIMTPDDEFGMYAYTAMDPIKQFETKWGHAMKKDIEGEKTHRALTAAGIRADAAGERGGARRSDAWYNRQHTGIKSVLDSILKTTGTAGSFIAGYAHENDAALRGVIEERVENEIENNGTPVRKAARTVIDDVRAGYDMLDKKARQHAAALAKAKVNPRDRKAVEAAQKEGNKDAAELLKTLAASEKNLGPSVTKYLESQLPTK